MGKKNNSRKVFFDEKKAVKVFKDLSAAYRGKHGIFNDVVLPQSRWPPDEEKSLIKDDREMANWLLLVALPMRGGIISEEPFKVWWDMRKTLPNLFDFELVAKEWTPAAIERQLKRILRRRRKENGGASNEDEEVVGYKIKEHANSWYQNAVVMHQRWGNDARNIFKGVNDFEQAFARVDYRRNKEGLRGMRRKIFSLFTIWLQEGGLIPVFPTPIPVDFHALRVFWATGIIVNNDWEEPYQPKPGQPEQLSGKLAIRVTESFIDQIAVWSQEFLVKNGFSHLVVNPAVWFLSRTLCAESFQNSSRKNGHLFFEAEDLKTNPHLWPKQYRNPCLYCPIEKYCHWAIPAGPYYRWGVLIRIGERLAYPQRALSFPDDFWKKVSYVKSRKNQSS